MARTRFVSWSYDCDVQHCDNVLDVTRGDHVSTGRGTVVHDQGDADAVARQAGWTVGRLVRCPRCVALDSGGFGA